MGLLSSTVSLTRYQVEGKLDGTVTERVADGLKAFAIAEVENDTAPKRSGWTSFETPYAADFEGSSFVIGTYFVFSLRIDKKNIPTKLVKKFYAIETAKRLADTGREFLSRNEKRLVKESVVNKLSYRIPSTPDVFDLIWDYEGGELWFFTTQMGANEELETLFRKSFDLRLIRLFPYTMAVLKGGLSGPERDALEALATDTFTE